MSRKLRIAAIALPVIFCAVVLVFLSIYATSHRTFISTPVLQRVSSPEESFQVWRANALHGRILVLIDRHLNADIDIRTAGFYPDEFKDQAALERCCSALRDDLVNVGQTDFPCTADGLNSMVIKRLVLYPLFINLRLPDPSGEITTLAEYMASPTRFDPYLNRMYENMLPRLNRLIIEQMHPGICPVMTEYPIAADNYVHQAVRSGIVRKIHHLISDNAWNEVSGVLSANETVLSSNGRYRINITEGVSVRIMPLRHMQNMSEPAIVVVNTDSLDSGEISLLPELIRRKLHADIVTISGSRAEEVIEALKVEYAKSK